ncbi:MAG: hypothetical protein WDM78_11940 [Puia sp.]
MLPSSLTKTSAVIVQTPMRQLSSRSGGTKELLEKVYHDLENAPLSEKMKALLVIGSKVQETGKARSAGNM